LTETNNESKRNFVHETLHGAFFIFIIAPCMLLYKHTTNVHERNST